MIDGPALHGPPKPYFTHNLHYLLLVYGKSTSKSCEELSFANPAPGNLLYKVVSEITFVGVSNRAVTDIIPFKT